MVFFSIFFSGGKKGIPYSFMSAMPTSSAWFVLLLWSFIVLFPASLFLSLSMYTYVCVSPPTFWVVFRAIKAQKVLLLRNPSVIVYLKYLNSHKTNGSFTCENVIILNIFSVEF